jgi:predicted HD phosphohydrolase
MAAGRLSMMRHVQGDKESPIERVIKNIEQLMEDRGGSLYDDFSTQEQHGRTTAFMAMKNGACDSTVAACYLHDIGHLLLNEHAGRGDFLADDKVHEEIGARFLKRAFPSEVTEVVRLHVDAKRYLCTVDPEYYAGLSQASQRSFELQGGCLSKAEAAEWASQPFAQQAAQLRKWEDEGKRLWRDGHVLEQDLPQREELMQIVRSVLEKDASNRRSTVDESL